MAMFVSGSSSSNGSLARLELYSSAAVGSNVLTVDGTLGRLFSVIDEMSGSIFSANTIAGLPVIEAFSDNKVTLGPYSSPVIIDSSGNISGSSGGELNVYPGSTNYKGINIISDGSARPSLEFKNESQGDLGVIYGTGTDGGMHVFSYGPLSFMANSDEVIRIHSSGAVSIGDGYVATDPGGDKVIIEGNVGIGTTVPSKTLTVVGDISASGDFDNVAHDGAVSSSAFHLMDSAYINDPQRTFKIVNSNPYTMEISTNATTPIGVMNLIGDSVGDAKVGINTTAGATPAATLEVRGTISGSLIRSNGDVVAYYSSDERLKDNIKLIENPIEKIQQLRGIEYQWNGLQNTYPSGSLDSGIIAQDVQKVLPQLVKETNKGYLGVRHDRLVGLLVESIKDQQEQINELKLQIKDIKNGSSS